MKESAFKGRTGVRRMVDALVFSASGFASALRHEEAFRLEVLLAIALVPLGLWLGADGVAKSLLVGSILLVLVVELLNSALEAAVDRISLEEHPLAKRAKDIGSAAVLLSLANAAVVWGLVLLA